jgi:hypothetical protein
MMRFTSSLYQLNRISFLKESKYNDSLLSQNQYRDHITFNENHPRVIFQF